MRTGRACCTCACVRDAYVGERSICTGLGTCILHLHFRRHIMCMGCTGSKRGSGGVYSVVSPYWDNVIDHIETDLV